MVKGRVILVICAAAAIVGAALLNYEIIGRSRFDVVTLIGTALLFVPFLFMLESKERGKAQRYLGLVGMGTFIIISNRFLNDVGQMASYSVIVGMMAGQVWSDVLRRWPTGSLGRIDGPLSVVPPDSSWRM